MSKLFQVTYTFLPLDNVREQKALSVEMHTARDVEAVLNLPEVQEKVKLLRAITPRKPRELIYAYAHEYTGHSPN